MPKAKVVLIATIGLLLFCLLFVIFFPTSSLNSSINKIVSPYSFSIFSWELQALSYELEEFVFGGDKVTADESYVVLEYFAVAEQFRAIEREIEAVRSGMISGDLVLLEAELDALQKQKDGLEDKAEKVLERQIKEILAQLDIYNPTDDSLGMEITFPPVNFALEQPPRLLVVSPRDRIERIRDIKLRQDITGEEIEEIEDAIDELGVSSLVVGLGGIATYPAFVSNDASLRFVINTAIEEWLHQYLFFEPLGFLYALDLVGFSKDCEVIIMNETLASMASKEIGDVLYQKYYSQYEDGSSQNEASGGADTEFDFFKEMRDIRTTVDEYLAQGEIEKAEEFMEQKRLFLASKGYYIRKLNQAYFAFYGTYADRPTSIDPIGVELRTLREQTASISDFINTVAAMTNHNDLINSIE